jgi:hypothetical protein
MLLRTLLTAAAGERAAWGRVAALALLSGIALAPQPQPQPRPAPAAGPRVGDPCRAVQTHPATFVAEPGGATSVVFDFAGGAARGRLPLGPPANAAPAFVTEVRLGSYESPGPGRPPACRVEGTYHFLCPATGSLDQICLTYGKP